MAAIAFLCFKIKFIHQKRGNLKTKQESGGEIGLVPPADLQDSGKRNNSTGNEETSSLKVSGVDWTEHEEQIVPSTKASFSNTVF